MARPIPAATRLALVAVFLAVTAAPASAQWFFTYDEGIRAWNRGDWNAVLKKMEQAKEEARQAKVQPGPNVRRTSGDFKPFIPDYYIGQAAMKLAEKAADDDERKARYAEALKAFSAAKGQVRKEAPEFNRMDAAVRIAEAALNPGASPSGGTGGVVTDTPPPPPPTVDEAPAIRGLVENGDRSLASGDWPAAVAAFSDAKKRLDAAPALKSQFATSDARIAEATLARDAAAAFQQLKDARDNQFPTIADALDRLNRTAGGITLSTNATRTLAADIPKRLAEARLGQTLMAADAAMRAKQWAAADDRYRSALRDASAVDFTSPRIKDLAGQLESRSREASLARAVSEQRFADVLKVDPANKEARTGQYKKGLKAYEDGRWADAAEDFDQLLKYAPGYADAADRKTAASMQVELGLAAQADEKHSADQTEARLHYERIVSLQREITASRLRDSKDVADTYEKALGRLRRIKADVDMATAKSQFSSGKWDDAGKSVELVLEVFPDDRDALVLQSSLSNRALQAQINTLTRRAQDALARRDLSEATRSALDLQKAFPQSTVASSVLAEVASIQVAAEASRRLWNRALLSAAAALSIGVSLILVSPRRRGRFFAVIGRPTAALSLYDRVLASDPVDANTLARAAALASQHGINAPLGRHFDAYLRSRPTDAIVAEQAADYFWAQGAKERAVDLYEQVVSMAGPALPPAAYDRITEVRGTSLSPRASLIAFEQARQRDPLNPGLVRLLVEQYAAATRTDAAALDVYKAAAEIDPDNMPAKLLLAQALNVSGDRDAALASVEIVVTKQPDHDRTLELLIEICATSPHETAAGALLRLERALPAASMVVVAEGVVERAPALRPPVAELYARQETIAGDTQMRTVLRALHCVDLGELDAALAALDESVASAPASRVATHALILAHQRYAAACRASGRPIPPGLVARVAGLQADVRSWRAAVMSWQQIVSVPEWTRKSMAEIERILDSQGLEGVVDTYFATAGWEVGSNHRQAAGGFTECSVTPGARVGPKLAAMFQKTRVFCSTAIVTVDDIVGLKRDVLTSHAGPDKCVAMVIATQAIRHDVYSLIYAFMTEEPAITLIPIQVQAIKEAIVKVRTRTHLEQTMLEWLGHTDMYETHNPVSNAATFFGRGQFINQLVQKISRGENFGIFGLRKIGKTSLVHRLRELSRDHLVAYVDLQGVTSGRSADVYLRLLESLTREMRLKHPDIPVPALQLDAEAARTDADVPGRFHADVLAIRGAFESRSRQLPHVLLLLDEIELMITSGGSPGFSGHQGFFRHVRGLYQQERFIVSAVVGANPTVCRAAKWNGQDNPVFQFYDEVFLAPMDQAECDQMVQGLGELMGVQYDSESLQSVFQQTAGHPFVARQLCSQLVKAFGERPLKVRRDMVGVAVDQYLAQGGEYFAGIVKGYLDDIGRRIVETIAKAGAAGERRGPIFERTQDVGGVRHVVDQTLGDLDLVGLLARDDDRYSIAIPLFRKWLRRSWLGLE